MGLRFKTFPQEFLEGRDAPPTHYSLKIESFSSLVKASVEKYNSDKFEVGEYKWKLQICPTGNKEKGGQGHISIYLVLVDTSSLPAGWAVNTIFSLFVFDQIRDKYYSVADAKVTRFHATKTEWGITKFMDLQVFNDSENGYLVNDTCVFGAEIFVLKQSRKGELLSLTEEAGAVTRGHIHTWKIKSLSTLSLERYDSDIFVVGDYKWRIRIYPKGNGEGKGNSISVFLCLEESTLRPDTKVYVQCALLVIDQKKAANFVYKVDNHFGTANLVWGSQKFMSFAKLQDPTKGFVVDDSCIIEAQVTLLGVVVTSA